MKKVINCIGYVFFSSLPLFASFVLTFNLLRKWKEAGYLGSGIDIETINNCLIYFTIVLPVLILIVKNYCITREIHEIESCTTSLLEMSKDSFYNLFKEKCKNKGLPVEMKFPLRIYESCYSDVWLCHIVLKYICRWLYSGLKPVKFVAINLDGSPIETNKTQFYVQQTWKMRKAVPQGIVGFVFDREKIRIDDNLKENAALYNLTESQQSRVDDLEFAIAYPCCNEQGRITHIITLDCKEKIKIFQEDEENLNRLTTSYFNKVRTNFPQLFP